MYDREMQKLLTSSTWLWAAHFVAFLRCNLLHVSLPPKKIANAGLSDMYSSVVEFFCQGQNTQWNEAWNHEALKRWIKGENIYKVYQIQHELQD